jgi:hypothetical protein
MQRRFDRLAPAGLGHDRSEDSPCFRGESDQVIGGDALSPNDRRLKGLGLQRHRRRLPHERLFRFGQGAAGLMFETVAEVTESPSGRATHIATLQNPSTIRNA